MNQDNERPQASEGADTGTAQAPGDEGGAPPEAMQPDAAAVGAPAAAAPAEVDFRDRWLRAEAEFQNFRRRALRDAEEASRAAEERVLRDLIEVLDDLDRAVDSARAAGADAAWLQGVELVANRARDALARHGVTAMEPVGLPFDPRVHEAMFEVDSAGHEPGVVVQVVRRGFLRGDRPLRPARVGVARARDE
jgi:molecular chaperone GrpE